VAMDISETAVIKYLQNECTEREIRQINEWLSEREENAQELFLMEALYKTKNLKRYASPEFLQTEKDKLLNRIQRETETAGRTSFPFKKLWTCAAAVAAVLAAAGIFYLRTTYSSLQTVIADQGKVEHLVLSDGTQVWLNQSAVLTCPERFKGKTRTVHLVGEGYFKAAKNADQPFVVETENMKVTVLGTAFNISASPASDISTVTLLEGEVLVKGNDNEGMVTLSPGQKAELNRLTHRLHVKEDGRAELDAVWHDRLIPFSRVSVGEIGKTLEKIYGVNVHFDPDLPSGTYSGVLKNQDSISAVLHSLKNSIPIEYEIRGKEVYIRGQQKKRP
jgi:ferric-dicitrate binding protein FerR (iron transport regulator)